jgi:hypothetical protein
MDIDRRRAEAMECRRKPRLIEENEIPTTITEASRKFTENEELAEEQLKAGNTPAMQQFQEAGRRKRKDVNYSQVNCKASILRLQDKLLQYLNKTL